MKTLVEQLEALAQAGKAKLAKGELSAADLDAFAREASKNSRRTRQRLLYLHATTPSISSSLIAAAVHEPVEGGFAIMDPMQKDPTYNSVHEAIRDGWQVIHFPLQMAGFDDHEIDILGYEFILQKLENYDE
jgi:hypothetical protein